MQIKPKTRFCLCRGVWRGQKKAVTLSFQAENLLCRLCFQTNLSIKVPCTDSSLVQQTHLINVENPNTCLFLQPENNVKRDASKLSKQEKHSSKYFKHLTWETQIVFSKKPPSHFSIFEETMKCSHWLTGIQTRKVYTPYCTDPLYCKGLCFYFWRCNAVKCWAQYKIIKYWFQWSNLLYF